MNRLQINPAANAKFQSICREYFTRLPARADIIVRERNGNSIETGDLERARDHIEHRGKKAQVLLLVAGAAVGAGFGGMIQNALDGKPLTYLIVFGTVTVAGGVFGYMAISRS
jgi:F0F1-type ATP synthase assembly protein I